MKFAYLIMAHNEPYVLEKLIRRLDYPDNDIYIHIDEKSQLINKDALYTNSAHLVVIPSRNVTWGGVSQVNIVLDLLAEALKTQHDYYHLISGVDLPLKKHSDMVAFFENNNGKEFIGITPNWAESPSIAKRYELHWFFQDKIGKKKNILWVLSRIITKIEMMFRYKRYKNEKIHFYGGPGWFSITGKAATYILNHGEWAKNRFKETICGDEIFIQTIIGNSAFAENIFNKESGDSYAECLRYARFNGPSPFVLNIADYNVLVNSNCIFARKFGTSLPEEKELVDKIFDMYK